MANLTMDKLVALCKNKGYIFAGSEIYGGLANTWDFGPLGVEFKNNIKKAWWQKFVQESPYNTGLDCAILMNREVWVASGHVGGFNDPLMDCKACKARFRADKLIEDFTRRRSETGDGWTNSELEDYIAEHDIVCPVCGKKDFTGIRQFNLMFKTHAGRDRGYRERDLSAARNGAGHFRELPANAMRTTRKKLPAGICQIGKSFRNEITPGNFIFRVREFEQMELEFFCKPGEDLEWFEYWRAFCRDWLLSLGMKKEHLRLRDHEKDKLAFYSKATTDFEYLFPFGWGELWGVADRTDYDLKQHSEHSGKALEYLDPDHGREVHPLLRGAFRGRGASGAFLPVRRLRRGGAGGRRRAHGAASASGAGPVSSAPCMPLQKNKLGDKAQGDLRRSWPSTSCVNYDETGSIGKRYRRQDETGTPFCVCVDFDTETTGNVTVRDRDTMQQEIVPVKDLVKYIEDKCFF